MWAIGVISTAEKRLGDNDQATRCDIEIDNVLYSLKNIDHVNT